MQFIDWCAGIGSAHLVFRQGIIYVKKGVLRKLSGMEALFPQGFDKHKVLYANKHIAQIRLLSQAGNAMTVNVMQALEENLLQTH